MHSILTEAIWRASSAVSCILCIFYASACGARHFLRCTYVFSLSCSEAGAQHTDICFISCIFSGAYPAWSKYPGGWGSREYVTELYTVNVCRVPYSTLLGNIMVCFVMTGEVMGGKNMAELVQNRQLFPVMILPVTSNSQNFS